MPPDLPDAPWVTAQASPPQEGLPDAPWAKPQPAPVDKPMPGFFEALSQGVGAGITDVGQSAQVITGSSAPQPNQETSPAAQPYEWRDLYEPSRGLAKTAYGIGKGSPTLAGGILGGWGGGELGAAVGTLGGPAAPATVPAGAAVGTLAGGALGAAAGSALQTIGPAFAQELKQTPNDPDGAWDRALEKTGIQSAAAGVGWGTFKLGSALGPLKHLAFQALGVQPAVGTAAKAATNVVEGRPATEGLGEAYAQSAVGTAIPAIGQFALAKPAGQKGAGPLVQRTAAQQNVAQSAQNKFMQADMLDNAAQAPGLTTDQVYNMRLQAEMTRQEAKHETFLSNIPPAVQDPGVVKGFIFRNFLPELTSEKAQQVAPKIASYASTRAQDYDSILHQVQKIRNQWDWVPFDDVKRWFDVYETPGATLPPDLAQKYPFMQRDMNTMRQWLSKAYFDENDVGSKADFVQNYFPHMFKNPNAVKSMWDNFLSSSLPGSQGATWFQKARYYDLITHALNNGLELRATNPVDLVAMRLMSGADMRAKMNLLDQLHRAGVAVPVKDAPGFLTNTMRLPQPWQQVDAPNGSRWMLAPDVQDLWKNGVESKGLWADSGIMGRAFRGWMGYKTMMVPIRLGASFFHPVHVLGINAVNNMSRALTETLAPGKQGIVRRVVALPEAAAQSAMDTFLALPIGLPFRGKAVRQAWAQPAETWSPEQQRLMDIYRGAGVSPQLAEQLRSQGSANFQKALVRLFGPDSTLGERALGSVELPYRTAQKMMGWISKPIFEHWIPNLKAAALTREAEALFRRRPDIAYNETKRNIALNAIGKQVDNRFGEMFYNSLFWNRTVKDAGIASFLSLGWNLGFAREFVGGALQPVMRRLTTETPTQALIRDATSKTTNLFLYGFGAAMLNGMMTKYFTGDDPQGLDYLLPRVGGTNPDGTPRRLSTPHYTRELPMAEKNIEDQGGNPIYGMAQMLWHKMMIAPLIEMVQNRDYFGGEIFDPNAPLYQRAKQFAMHMWNDQINPMSVSGANRALQLSGKESGWGGIAKAAMEGDKDVWLPFLGYGPAPAYASRTATENKIDALGRQFVYPGEKPFKESQEFRDRMEARTAYKVAVQQRDQEAVKAAAKKMQDLGMTARQIKGVGSPLTSAQKTFQRLGQVAQSQQVYLLKGMTPEEFRLYYPQASKKTRADPEIRALAQEYRMRP